MRTAGVIALVETSGEGVGSTAFRKQRTNKLSGDSTWQKLEHEFEILAATQEAGAGRGTASNQGAGLV